MLDLASIMFSSVMMLFIIIRALKMDRQEPWFPAVRRAVVDRDARQGQGRRR